MPKGTRVKSGEKRLIVSIFKYFVGENARTLQIIYDILFFLNKQAYQCKKIPKIDFTTLCLSLTFLIPTIVINNNIF